MLRLGPLLVLSLVALAGCDHKAIDFNNQVATIHARVGAAVEEFARILHPAVEEGLAPTAEQFAQAAERLRSELAAAEERSEQLRVPDLPQAAELYAAHQEFLAWQRAKLEEELLEIERLLGAENLTAQSAHAGLNARLQAMREKERRQLQTLHAAQRRFAEANGLKLTQVAE
jgi:hypothetical protein